MKPFLFLCVLSGCAVLLGCGEEKNSIVGADDPEGAATYDQLIAEQQMGAQDMTKMEQEMKKEAE